jgi:hypothetical protein
MFLLSTVTSSLCGNTIDADVCASCLGKARRHNPINTRQNSKRSETNLTEEMFLIRNADMAA